MTSTTLARLKGLVTTPSSATTYYIADLKGIRFYKYDVSDKSTPENDFCIVGLSGKRFKLIGKINSEQLVPDPIIPVPPTPVIDVNNINFYEQVCEEGATIEIPPDTWVAYGTDGKYFFRKMSGKVWFSNDVFGDPIPGAFKKGYILKINITPSVLIGVKLPGKLSGNL